MKPKGNTMKKLIQAANAKARAGDNEFACGNYATAAVHYAKAAEYLEIFWEKTNRSGKSSEAQNMRHLAALAIKQA